MTHVTMTPSSHVTVIVRPVLENSSSRSQRQPTTAWEHLVSSDAVYIVHVHVHVHCTCMHVLVLCTCISVSVLILPVHVYTQCGYFEIKFIKPVEMASP